MSASALFKKVAHGGILFTAGILGSNALQFVSGLLVIWLVTTAEYGFISLAYVLINLMATIAGLGFISGLPRFMAAEKNGLQNPRVTAAVSSAVLLGLIVGTTLSALMYTSAPFLSYAFGKDELADILKLFSLLVVPLSTLRILSAVFRGLGNTKAKVLFVDLALSASRLALIWLVLVVGAGFESVLLAYIASAWLAVLMFTLYTVRTLRSVLRPRIDWGVAKELLFFSLPLLGVGLAANVMGWSGTLVLGAFSSTDEVAFFNVPMRVVFLIQLPLVAVSYLYLPVVTDLIANGGQDKLREMYAITTKWAFLLTLPLLLYLFLDTEFIIGLLFGERYRGIEWVLRILVIGYSLNTLVGPNGTTLMSAGSNSTVFTGVLLAAGGAVALCLLLVPQYGAMGAALGTALAQFVSNGYLSIMLYIKMGIKPFSIAYLKPVILTIILSVATAFYVGIEDQASWIWHALFFFLLVVFSLTSPITTMAMTDVDVELLAGVERRFLKSTRFSDRLDKRLAVSSVDTKNRRRRSNKKR